MRFSRRKRHEDIYGHGMAKESKRMFQGGRLLQDPHQHELPSGHMTDRAGRSIYHQWRSHVVQHSSIPALHDIAHLRCGPRWTSFELTLASQPDYALAGALIFCAAARCSPRAAPRDVSKQSMAGAGSRWGEGSL